MRQGVAGRSTGERARPARGRVCLLALAAVVLAAAALAGPAQAITIPAGFDDQAVTVLPRPTAMDWTPDGRMVITTHAGVVRIFKNGALNPTSALDWRNNTCKDEEWGMLGIAVDPNFVVNNYVYIYYTAKKFGVCTKNDPASPVNRVSRFVLGSNDLIDPLSETPIVDGIQDPDGIHAGGDVEFGPDGNLWISAGDGGCDFREDSGCYPFNDAAQDLGVLSGKILRVTKTGGIPLDNPYAIGPDTAQCSPTGYTLYSGICREVYSYGLRNPFRFAIDPNSVTPSVRANDVGLNTWEEVNQITPGGNFGWNVREGNCVRDSRTDCGPPPAGMSNPIDSYDHNTGCVSVTASDFVPNGLWPSQYDGDYLFGDLVCQKLWRLEPDGSGGYTRTEFATGIPWLIDGVFGPNGPSSKAYYYISWEGFPNDVIRKIVFTGMSNHTPSASATATPAYGNLPLNVAFNGSGSSDPDNDTLTYDWDFGDGSPHSSAQSPNHTYTTHANFDATLTVTDTHGADDTATVRISAGNFPPDVFIDSPFQGKLFKVGEQMTLVGSAEDPEDGALPNGSLVWRVERHHSTHFHPYLPETAGNNIPLVGPEPEDLSAATNSYLEIILTATDSDGLSTTVTRNIQPKKVNITFDTIAAGLTVEVAGSTLTAPATVTSWQDWGLIVNAPDQADAQGRWWVFDGWSDLGTRTHTIQTPGSPLTYTAIYKQLLYPRPGGATPLQVPLVPEYQPCTSPNTQHVVPLNSASCTPAVLESPLLTLSSTGRGTARARMDVVPGNISTPADEADVRIKAMAGDVLSNTSGTPDYTGQLILKTRMRITDRANGSSAAVPATSQDFEFAAPVNCVPTPTIAGSNCSLDTSSDALVPGFAREGKRAVISAFSMQLLDAGPDGVIAPSSDPFGLGCPPTCGSGDEQVFLRQGVFTP